MIEQGPWGLVGRVAAVSVQISRQHPPTFTADALSALCYHTSLSLLLELEFVFCEHEIIGSNVVAKNSKSSVHTLSKHYIDTKLVSKKVKTTAHSKKKSK